MNNKTFLVKLNIACGKYEKTSTQLLSANNKAAAEKAALIGECHNDQDDGAYFEDGIMHDVDGEFAYTVQSCEEIKAEHVEVLKLYI